MDWIRLAEERSLALHREIAERLLVDPVHMRNARAVLERWERGGQVSTEHARRWCALLDGPLEVLLAKLFEDDEEARVLRKTSPFVGIIDPRRRWRIWREVRERLERAS